MRNQTYLIIQQEQLQDKDLYFKISNSNHLRLVVIYFKQVLLVVLAYLEVQLILERILVYLVISNKSLLAVLYFLLSKVIYLEEANNHPKMFLYLVLNNNLHRTHHYSEEDNQGVLLVSKEGPLLYLEDSKQIK